VTPEGRRRALVTGGAGFIGGAAAAALLARGHSVVVLDDLSAGTRDHVPAGAEFVQADVSDPEVAARLPSPFDLVVHCAAQISVHRSMLEPDFDRRVNLEGTANLLRIVGPTRPRFVFLSTGGAIYGERTEPASEDAPPRPASYYGIHKLAAEGYVTLSGLSHAVLRPANVFGPGQRAGSEGGVVSIFLDALLRGEPIRINGDGEQRRDFVFIDDVVQAILALGESDVCGVFNAGSGHTTSVLELVRCLESVVGVPAQVQFDPPRPGDLRFSSVGASRLIATGLWEAATSLEEGIRRMARDPAPR
jgi:UDP-glucose 4-epimerase